MYTSVLLVVNSQDPTPGFDRLHRHQFLPSESVELELKTAPIGRTRWNLVKIWDRFGFIVFLWSTLTQPSKKFQGSTPFRRRPCMGGRRKQVVFFKRGHGFAKVGHQSVGIQKINMVP